MNIGYGHMGNGYVFWTQDEEEDGDYKKIAHINCNREVKFYCELPEDVKVKITHIALTDDSRVSVSQESKVFYTRPCDVDMKFRLEVISYAFKIGEILRNINNSYYEIMAIDYLNESFTMRRLSDDATLDAFGTKMYKQIWPDGYVDNVIEWNCSKDFRFADSVAFVN